ncbi:MAG: hypothetical protein QXH92_04090 [Candidatus Aenigmatarchaeota archaeon]
MTQGQRKVRNPPKKPPRPIKGIEEVLKYLNSPTNYFPKLSWKDFYDEKWYPMTLGEAMAADLAYFIYTYYFPTQLPDKICGYSIHFDVQYGIQTTTSTVSLEELHKTIKDLASKSI